MARITSNIRKPAWVAALFLLCLLGSSPEPGLLAQESRYLAGQLLVATPEMGDPRFAETVIYMLRHDETGAMGLIINKPIARGPISDLLRGLGVEDEEAKGEIILHYGGPVEPLRVFVLHTDDYADSKTQRVDGGIAVSAGPEIMRAMARGKGPRESIFALGYAGWAPGQLEGEIGRGDWFSIPAEPALIFQGDPAKKWDRATARGGSRLNYNCCLIGGGGAPMMSKMPLKNGDRHRCGEPVP